MYWIDIESWMEEEASQLAQEMMENSLYDCMSYNDVDEQFSHAYIGSLGEIAFQMLLEREGIPYIAGSYIPDQHSDNWDVNICGRIIDVKIAEVHTSSTPNNNWTFGYPCDQHPEQKYGIVVGLYYPSAKQIGFYGIISGAAVANKPTTNSNSYAKFDYLTSNYEFSYGDMNQDIVFLIYYNILRHEIPNLYYQKYGDYVYEQTYLDYNF